MFLTGVPWILVGLGWVVLHPRLVETTEFERLFGTDAQWGFMAVVAIAWVVSGIACALSASSLGSSPHKRAVSACVWISGLTFSAPIALFLWFQWMIISQ